MEQIWNDCDNNEKNEHINSAFDRSHMRKPQETQPDDLQFSYLAGIVVSSIFPRTILCNLSAVAYYD